MTTGDGIVRTAPLAWLVRGGRDGEREDAALREGLVIAGWDDLGDLSAVQTKNDIRDALVAVYPDASKATVANWTGQLWRFARELTANDWVVMPLKSRGGIAIGQVSGPYGYRADSPPDPAGDVASVGHPAVGHPAGPAG